MNQLISEQVALVHINIDEQPKCSFCNNQNAENRKVVTLQESLILCPQCYGEISEHYFGEKTLKFENKIFITSQFLPYSLRRGICDGCENLQILWKLNKCNHYLCTNCCVQLAMVNYYQTKCPILDCDALIDDYFIVQFIQKEYIQYLIKPKMMCYNTQCHLSFQIEPQGYLRSNTIFINDQTNTVHCSECKMTFCGYCWRNHHGNCNFEQQFQNYRLKARLINCPNCKVICEPQRCNEMKTIFTPFKVQNQQCTLCNYHFCLLCSQPLQIFEHNDTIQWTCFPCKQYHRSYFGLVSILSKFIPSRLKFVLVIVLITTILFFLNLFTLIIIIIVSIVIQFVEIQEKTYEIAENLALPCPKIIRIIAYPFVILISFIIAIVIYTLSFVPLMIYNIYRIYK